MSEKRFCKTCNKNTYHDKLSKYSVPERVFFGVWTLGFSEIYNNTYYKCTKCNKD